MKLRICRRSSIPPSDLPSRRVAKEAKLADLDEMVVESAILSYVIGERATVGVGIGELTRELLVTLSGDCEAAVVERALAALVDAQLLRRKQEGTIYPGPRFGSAVAPDAAPRSN